MRKPKVLRRWLKAAAFPVLLLALNFYIAKDLFSLEYSQFMGSIEAAYISISRYMIENWRDLTWFPLWYGGIPFQNTYPPLLHAVVALAAVLFRISPAHAHHIVTAIFYCLGPVALYALALRLTGSRSASFWVCLDVFDYFALPVPDAVGSQGCGRPVHTAPLRCLNSLRRRPAHRITGPVARGAVESGSRFVKTESPLVCRGGQSAWLR